MSKLEKLEDESEKSESDDMLQVLYTQKTYYSLPGGLFIEDVFSLYENIGKLIIFLKYPT